MVWSFRLSNGLESWYILPEKERMKGFANFYNYLLPQDVEKVGKKGDGFVLQTLGHQDMKPGKGYIVWFKFKDVEKPQVTLSLNIVPKNSASSYKEIFPMLFPAAN